MDEMLAMGIAESVQKLNIAAMALEKLAAVLTEKHAAFEAVADETVGRIVATVESREAELERKLAEAEAKIAELVASAGTQPAGRKTLPTSMATMLAKQGVVMDSVEAGAIDGALASLSIEQRIAVKSELIRAGVLNPSDRG